MLHDEDLDAAVGAAIVTQAQADALREFAAKRSSTMTGCLRYRVSSVTFRLV